MTKGNEALPEQTDRVSLVVEDADGIEASFRAIFDTEIVGDELDQVVVARRVTLQWGHDQVELLEPTGEGPASRFLGGGRSGLFAAGIAMGDPGPLAARIEGRGIPVHEQGPDRYLVLPEDCRGTGIILSRKAERPRIGLADSIWQFTYAAADLDEMEAFYIDLLDLSEFFTSRYHSDLFGYDGGITWFDARDGAPLDSIEYLEPTDADKALARFVERNGSGIYMCAIQTDEIPEIRARVEAIGPGWTGAGDLGGYIHPMRLGGMLLGLCYFEEYNRGRPLPGRKGFL